ncbi:MAG: DUF6494 family protein [Chloroflexota bacterium]|nr:DUF6494 family protein [Chloroflexota bacterium]
MKHEQLNQDIRKFLKRFGVSAQQAIERAVQQGLEQGTLAGDESFRAEARLIVEEVGVDLVIEGDIRLQGEEGKPSLFPTYSLTLHRTYYDQGFFNVPVDYDRHVREDEGPVKLVLGKDEQVIEGYVNRSANTNGTARIMGRTALRDWFQDRFQVGDQVDVTFQSPDVIQLLRSQP